MEQSLLSKKEQTTKFSILRFFFTLKMLPKKIHFFVAGVFAVSSVLWLLMPIYLQSNYKEYLSAEAENRLSVPASIEESVEILNNKTPLHLIYNNDVQKYVDLYLDNRLTALKEMAGRSELYFPIIEECLDKYDLPIELKYLAALESGLNPLAKSKSGAVGLWQFLYNTCDLVGLEVNSYIDERRDVYKSTDAACRYLQYLYRTFGDWNLAMAAYNGGPGEIRKAIEKTGGNTDYWKIRQNLSSQSAEYIPAFIALNYLFEFETDTFVYFDNKPDYGFRNIDTIHVNNSVSLHTLSEKLNCSLEDLRFLNPVYKKDFIPYAGNALTLVLPSNKVNTYYRNTNKIALESANPDEKMNLFDTVSNATCIMHIVEKGEFFHKIAMQYNCTVDLLLSWNKLENMQLIPGQKLKIWIKN